MSGEIDPQLRSAIEELERYLADQVAPLLAADSIEVLLDYPPMLTAEALHVWAHEQLRFRGSGETLGDLAYHALKKIQLFEEFGLLPGDRFTSFLAGVAGRLIELAPAGDREQLAGRLVYLRQGRATTGPIVDRLHRAPDAAPPARPATASATPPGLSAEELRALRRFTMLVERLPGGGAAGGERGAGSEEAARQLLVLAAAEASNAGELERRLARLQQAGVGPAFSRDLVRSLAAAIPDWVVRRDGGIEIVRGESVEAVRRVVKLAGDRARTTERWKDLLRVAAECFNEGAYARAVTLLDLADRMVAENEVDSHVADLARGATPSAFEAARLLAAAAEEENRPILRRLVEFFPDWSIRELLDDIVYQPDPKRRRLILALIEIWGADAYGPVLERLEAAIAEGSRDPNAWWYHRNLVYLLHRLPRPDNVDPKQVLELVGQFSSLGNHPSFQRETFQLLALLPGGLGAPLLVQRLNEADRALGESTPAAHDPREMEKILNSLAVALVRSGTPGARRALIEHALAQRQRPGEASPRLRELANVDLVNDRQALSRLLEAARFLMPKKVLGFVVSRNEATLADVARALSGTSDPAAKRLLAELGQRFPDREIGQIGRGGAAAIVQVASARSEDDTEESEEFLPMAPPSEPARPRVSLAGDLEVFGLPGLIQNLQQSEASGRLVLRHASGAERASLDLVRGGLASCRCGTLEGEAAFYQVFERPAPGTFEFARAADVAATARPHGTDLLALLMEAMRRFDEFQRLLAFVPDEARLRSGSARPSSPASERDGELVRRVWTRLRETAEVRELEAAAGVDSYRVRSLLAHWLEEGAAEIELPEAAAG